MLFEPLPALPGHSPSVGQDPGFHRSLPGSQFSDLIFRTAKIVFDRFSKIARLFLAQVNVGAPADLNPRPPAKGEGTRASGPGMSTANFGAN